MSVHIVDDEQRRDRPQPPCALTAFHSVQSRDRKEAEKLRSFTVAALFMRCLRRVAPPCICPRGARNAAHCTFTTGC